MILVDMAIPKNCHDCIMNTGEYSPDEIEKRYCALTGMGFCKKDYRKRPDCCPINKKEVVFCKDCKHATMTADGKMCKYCEMDTDDFGDQRDVYHDADFFCAYGERDESK